MSDLENTTAPSPSRHRQSVRAEVDETLRADVRTLGGLLGRVLSAIDPGLLDDVEKLRTLSIAAYAEDDQASFSEAETLVAGFSPERAEQVARAFTAYFHLVNLAEEQHRIRRLRERDVPGRAETRTDTFAGAITQLTAEVGAEETAKRVAALRFHPVLTAHPTEARRPAISGAIRRIAALLQEREDPRLGYAAGIENERRLLEEIDTLWRTSPLRSQRPTPVDEVRTAMNVFDTSLFQVVPRVYRALDDWLLGAEAGVAPARATSFVRYGSWIGADRDGNPFVTAKVTRQAASIASEHVLLGYEHAATRIGRTLTLSAEDAPASAALNELWTRQRALGGFAADELEQRSHTEPHRRALLFITRRIIATRTRDADLAYTGPSELLAELRTIQSSLREGGATRAASGELQHLIWQVETFGFHLADLEVRQHSKVHRQVLAELRAGGSHSELTDEVLEVFHTIQSLQKRFGVNAARRYIVSFTQSSEDLGNVYELAQHALGADAPVLDVIPLFETFADLNNSVDILTGALELEPVQARLAATGRKLEVMLGYSDSSKDVGPVSATLALYSAQSRIAEWAKNNDIELTLFHGRGGALGRGGGPANEAVLAQPPHSVDGRFKLTEQGEVIFAQYGDQTIAARHLEQMASATLLAEAPSNQARNAQASATYASLAAQLDESSRNRFYELVHAEGFAQWFGRVTPQEEVGLLALGSRPARRGLSLESLEDLRAIPWVFAWSQARVNLTGWFGLGTALASVGDTELLRSAYAEWPLFRTMIDNVQMSLAKTDERLARRYLALGDRDDLAQLVLDEMALTHEQVLLTSGQSELLEGRAVLQRAVQLRSPYVDALSLLQLRALREIRATGSADAEDRPHRLMLLAVNGVAAGLQNTG
ncbi:MAG: phosphoenolpyruvate carboxylase [Microbacteriaceae bacterium]|nr:phosphoenolpyruvate carboxylase [Microbacteriaceae bacterium]MCL2795741.1 phosphoenolpyruvate carboxylase [Microbacteriaceae bacterium]